MRGAISLIVWREYFLQDLSSSVWTEVDLSEVSEQAVTSQASVKLKVELSKLVTIFQMKHILLSLNLW